MRIRRAKCFVTKQGMNFTFSARIHSNVIVYRGRGGWWKFPQRVSILHVKTRQPSQEGVRRGVYKIFTVRRLVRFRYGIQKCGMKRLHEMDQLEFQVLLG